MSGNYTYTVARIRVLETRMFTPQQVERMVEAPDLDSAFLVLQETSYGDHISSSSGPFDFKEIILKELKRSYNFLNNAAGDDPSLKTLWRKYDYNGAKIVLRGQKLGDVGAEELLLEFGTVDNTLLSRYILKGEGSLPEWLEGHVNRALLAFQESGNPKDIDIVLDEAYLNDLLKCGERLLVRLSRLWSDMDYPFGMDGDAKTIDILRDTKRVSFGVEPLIAFWIAKELEAKIVHQILIGKKHRLNFEAIKEKGVVTYV